MPERTDARISLGVKTLYGVGSIASGVKDTAFNVFLLFFYTQVVGLTGALAGAAIFCALLVDAVTDPLVGYWSDRFRSRWGRRHPFMVASALPMGIAFYLLFHPPNGGQGLLFLWMLGFSVLVRLFMTFYMVPSSALNAEMTQSYDERTSLSSFRVLLGWIGGLVFATLGYVVIFAGTSDYPDGRLNPNAYSDFALLGAVLIVLAILLCAAGTRSLIPRLKQVADRSAASHGLRQDFGNLLANKPFVLLATVIFVSASAIGFTDVIGLYMLTYFWGLSTEQLAILTFAALAGTVGAFLTAPWLSSRFDKQPIGLAAMSLVIVCYPGLILLRLQGVLPENGSPSMLAMLCLNAIVTVYAAVTVTILFVSMIGDTVDRNELATGQRQEAAYTSAFTFSLKATSGLGGLIAGVTLDLVALPTGADVADVSQATLDQLGIAVASVIAGFWTLAFFLMRRYPLTRGDHAEVLRQLAQRSA